MEIHLRKEQIEKYKDMEFEDIMTDLQERGKIHHKQEIIDCAKWIMEECQCV